jgi:hypothetical protein
MNMSGVCMCWCHAYLIEREWSVLGSELGIVCWVWERERERKRLSREGQEGRGFSVQSHPLIYSQGRPLSSNWSKRLVDWFV